MPRSGPRPHVWKVQGEIPHQQYIAWLRMKAQADFRGEPWQFDFEDFQRAWLGHWERRGRGVTDYCLTRINPNHAWSNENVQCIPRLEHLKNSQQRKKESKTNGKYSRRSITL